MRKFLVALILGLSIAHTPVYAADAMHHQMGDWFATFGKSGTEKEMVLAERKSKRAMKKAGKSVEKGAKDVKKSLKSIGD